MSHTTYLPAGRDCCASSPRRRNRDISSEAVNWVLQTHTSRWTAVVARPSYTSSQTFIDGKFGILYLQQANTSRARRTRHGSSRTWCCRRPNFTKFVVSSFWGPLWRRVNGLKNSTSLCATQNEDNLCVAAPLSSLVLMNSSFIQTILVFRSAMSSLLEESQ